MSAVELWTPRDAADFPSSEENHPTRTFQCNFNGAFIVIISKVTPRAWRLNGTLLDTGAHLIKHGRPLKWAQLKQKSSRGPLMNRLDIINTYLPSRGAFVWLVSKRIELDKCCRFRVTALYIPAPRSAWPTKCDGTLHNLAPDVPSPGLVLLAASNPRSYLGRLGLPPGPSQGRAHTPARVTLIPGLFWHRPPILGLPGLVNSHTFVPMIAYVHFDTLHNSGGRTDRPSCTSLLSPQQGALCKKCRLVIKYSLCWYALTLRIAPQGANRIYES